MATIREMATAGWKIARRIETELLYIMATIGAIAIIIWAMDVGPVIEIEKGVIIGNNSISPGETLKVEWTVTKHRDCSGTVTRYTTGSCGTIKSITTPTTARMGRSTVTVYFHIDEDTPEDTNCLYQTYVIYYCSVIDHIFSGKRIDFPAIPFRIGKKQKT